MAHKERKRPAKNRRKNESFIHRYGMSRSEWALLKKEDPKKAQEVRERALRLLA